MKIFREAQALSQHLHLLRQSGHSIGFVPTMGALHQGHAKLIHHSNAENDLTVVSIFVNPLQFNNSEDLAKYPVTTDMDVALLESIGVTALFLPIHSEMYPTKPTLRITFGNLENIMEGEFRPGHFQGVGIVVAKLLHIVHPDRVYFGQKDLQQCAVIERLLYDLSFTCKMVVVPTVREADGLAMSSRNVRLNDQQRAQAPNIYKILRSAQGLLLSGKQISEVQDYVNTSISNTNVLKLEYFQIVDSATLEPLSQISSAQASLCIAVFAGSVRLIDNIYLYD